MKELITNFPFESDWIYTGKNKALTHFQYVVLTLKNVMPVPKKEKKNVMLISRNDCGYFNFFFLELPSRAPGQCLMEATSP